MNGGDHYNDSTAVSSQHILLQGIPKIPSAIPSITSQEHLGGPSSFKQHPAPLSSIANPNAEYSKRVPSSFSFTSRRRRAEPFLNNSALFPTSNMAMAERPAQGCLGDYIRALEEERNKIEVFQRELPLCLQLITQAIQTARLQMANNRPVLEESLSLRRSPTSTEEEEEEEEEEDAPSETKADWFISLQLQNRKPIAVSLKKTGGGAFRPFERENHRASTTVVTAASSSATVVAEGDGNDDEDVVVVDKDKGNKEGEAQSHRKVRRCWSPELHRRFLIALNHLGGSHAATPKQIREMMKVDGLTNDEIKSHLQKYRLHHRRPSPASQSSSHGYQQPPQLVLIGGILVQPPEYVIATGAVAQPAAIYTPVPSNLPPLDAGVNATSPATSATTADSI
ncbi:hypothetical protein ZIOFF_043431 [Zingiber officinale]|uniref:HTH myb-type domain-containing protein n=1 Tax=Zingiber officinale TaxID=94328 RepID=A0A8J5FTA1_ZINOF|nr:hypothetical protein ZIOFF_043431 [Zingiber officinale]